MIQILENFEKDYAKKLRLNEIDFYRMLRAQGFFFFPFSYSSHIISSKSFRIKELEKKTGLTLYCILRNMVVPRNVFVRVSISNILKTMPSLKIIPYLIFASYWQLTQLI